MEGRCWLGKTRQAVWGRTMGGSTDPSPRAPEPWGWGGGGRRGSGRLSLAISKVGTSDESGHFHRQSREFSRGPLGTPLDLCWGHHDYLKVAKRMIDRDASNQLCKGLSPGLHLVKHRCHLLQARGPCPLHLPHIQVLESLG